MGAFDIFEIVATGRGAHAAMPHLGRDPMPFAAHLINALQTIVARNLHPLEAGVVSVTQVHGGDTWNVIPQEVVLRGTARSFLPRGAGHRSSGGCARSSRASPRPSTCRRRCATSAAIRRLINTRRRDRACAAPRPPRCVGAANVDTDPTPSMGSEDFAFMLQKKPGCYVWLGGGRGADTPNLHNPHYDFNDDALAIGAELLGDAGRAAARRTAMAAA